MGLDVIKCGFWFVIFLVNVVMLVCLGSVLFVYVVVGDVFVLG